MESWWTWLCGGMMAVMVVVAFIVGLVAGFAAWLWLEWDLIAVGVVVLVVSLAAAYVLGVAPETPSECYGVSMC